MNRYRIVGGNLCQKINVLLCCDTHQGMLRISQNHEKHRAFMAKRLPHRLQTLSQTGQDSSGQLSYTQGSEHCSQWRRVLLAERQAEFEHRSDMFMNDAYQLLRFQLSLVVEPQPD